MEWEKAKKYIVFLLLAVNVVLFGLNIFRANDTVVGIARVNNIKAYLETRGITVSCTLPNKYRPMAKLSTGNFSYDYLKLRSIFMPMSTDVQRTDRYSSVVFTSGNSSLVVKGSSIEYIGTLDEAINTAEAAMAYSNKMADTINENFGNFVFHSVMAQDGGFSVKYYCRYDSTDIFSNFLYVFVKDTSVNIALNYSDVSDSGIGREDIIGSDEAVFAAVDRIKEDYPEKCVISAVELGYYDSLIADLDENYAVPCYVIRSGTKEYFVNACTGEVM